MKSMEFIFDLFKKFPGLMTKNIVLVVAVGLLGAGSLFTVTPVVDFFIHPDLQSASPLTIKVVEAMESVGLPVTLTSLLVMIVTFITLASVFQVFTRYSLLQTKYVLSKDIMIGTFKDFFDARWSFFSASKQGTLINTLTRELSVVGTAFGGIGLLFASMLQLLFFIAIPLYISWKVTVSSLGIGLLFAVPFGLVMRIPVTPPPNDDFDISRMSRGLAVPMPTLPLFNTVIRLVDAEFVNSNIAVAPVPPPHTDRRL